MSAPDVTETNVIAALGLPDADVYSHEPVATAAEQVRDHHMPTPSQGSTLSEDVSYRCVSAGKCACQSRLPGLRASC